MKDASSVRRSTRKAAYLDKLKKVVPTLRELKYCWVAVCALSCCSLDQIFGQCKERGGVLVGGAVGVFILFQPATETDLRC